MDSKWILQMIPLLHILRAAPKLVSEKIQIKEHSSGVAVIKCLSVNSSDING